MNDNVSGYSISGYPIVAFPFNNSRNSQSTCHTKDVFPHLFLLKRLKKRLKSRIALNGYSHDRATGHHLPYGITQFYLPPDTSESAPP